MWDVYVYGSIFIGSKYTCTSLTIKTFFGSLEVLIVCILLIKVIGHRSFLTFPKHFGWNVSLFSHFELFPVFNFLSKLMFGLCSIGPISFCDSVKLQCWFPALNAEFFKSHTMPIIIIILFSFLFFFFSLSSYHCVCDQRTFLQKCK